MTRQKARPSFRNGKYRGLHFELKLVRKYRNYEPYPVRNPRDVFEFMYELTEESSEHVYSLHMDGRNRVSGIYTVAKGGLTKCVVDPREIYKAALECNSPAFLLVHNHPSGDPRPSREDIDIARLLREGAGTLELKLLDSIIIGDDCYFSLREDSLI